MGALCDAAINEIPFTSSTAVYGDEEMLEFNFTTINNSTTSSSSSSEKYLYKALNLLRGNTARTRFALGQDPDRYSYNTILNAAAKCSKPNFKADYTKLVMIACLRGMKERGIHPDMFTYNARIQAALASDGDEAAIRLIDQILDDPKLEPDRYTLNFMLKPFINAGRQDEIWSILDEFYELNVESNSNILSSAFEAFLNTIVQVGEVEFAKDIFSSYFLTSNMLPGRRFPRRGNRLTPKTRHFNILLGGYSKAHQLADSKKGKSHNLLAKEGIVYMGANDTVPEPVSNGAFELLEMMIDIGVPLDGYSVTSLMSLPFSSSQDITSLLKRIEPEMLVDLNSAAYRSIITAYGRAGDPSSALWMAEEMTQECRNSGRSVESWNVLLGALTKGCGDSINTGMGSTPLDILNSSAARARRNIKSQEANYEESENQQQFISLVNRKTCLDGAMTILETMRNRIALPEGYTAPKPNSQTYCLVASALSSSGTSESNPNLALTLFRNAMEEGVAADGRFINAVLRCFGDDIDGALDSWKKVIGPAAVAHERKSNKRGSNMISAYNGMMHVAGRACRPDIAVRIVYAMNKGGLEPTEVTLNSYHAGKRIALLEDNDVRKNLGLRNQYESLVSVECTKYNSKDKRRANDRKIRIIL